MDDEGYPTEEEIEVVKNWDFKEDYESLMEYVRERWWYPDMSWKQDGDWYYISTLGWSGNEELVGALMDNAMFHLLCWYSSQRGGHFIFDLSRWRWSQKGE